MIDPADRGQGIPKVLVVGASGFVGAAIVRSAIARRDMRPIACMRRPTPELFRLGVEIRACDAAHPAELAHALEGVTYAINCMLGSPATMLAATRNLCQAARGARLRRIVHVSSMAVYGDATGAVNEETVLRPIGAYGRAKAECEAVIRDFITAGGDAVVIRPGCVYGPGGEQWVGRIARWLRAGRLGELGKMADGHCNLTFNEDLAKLILASLTAPDVTGEAFNMSDADPGTWNQYFTQLGLLIGASIRRIPRLRMHLEAAVLAPPLQMIKIAGRRVGMRPASVPEPITPSLLRLWRQPIRLDSSKVDERLGPQRTAPEQGLARSAEWFRSTGI